MITFFLNRSGLLGRSVYSYFSDDSYRAKYPLPEESSGSAKFKWDCVGLYNSRKKGDLKQLDLTNLNQVEQFLKQYQVDKNVYY